MSQGSKNLPLGQYAYRTEAYWQFFFFTTVH